MSKFSKIITFIILVICFLQTAEPKKMKNKQVVSAIKNQQQFSAIKSKDDAKVEEKYCEEEPEKTDDNDTPQPSPQPKPDDDKSKTDVSGNDSETEGGDGKSSNFDIPL